MTLEAITDEIPLQHDEPMQSETSNTKANIDTVLHCHHLCRKATISHVWFIQKRTTNK